MLDTPVLLLIFNRPENTRQVFEEIRKARPNRLFIAAGGARTGKDGEQELCDLTRNIVANVDWDCDVKHLYRDHNLGCKHAVSKGITWFFEQVEYGIILEDDCKPDQSFFTYCRELLHRYLFDQRVMMICGTNYLSPEISQQIKHSYFFADYYPIWGWATWKRAWQFYDVEMKDWQVFKDSKQLFWLFSNETISRYYESMFDLITTGFDTWDIQWWYTCIFQHGLAIIPRNNLISNIGNVGTHSNTQGDFRINMPTVPLGQLEHPAYVVPDKYLNEMTFRMSHAQLDIKNQAELHSRMEQSPPSLKNFVKRMLSGLRTRS